METFAEKKTAYLKNYLSINIPEIGNNLMEVLYTKPLKYTLYEGGDWIDWTNKELLRDWSKLRDKYSVNVCGKNIHSFLFEDSIQWDCINGWRIK